MKKVLLILLAVAFIGGGALLIVSKNNDSKKPAAFSNKIVASEIAGPKVTNPSKCLVYTSGVIKYCDSGFSDFLRIELGEMDATVTVTNSSSKVLDFEITSHKDNPDSHSHSSAQEHKLDPAMNLGKIDPGKSKTFEAVVPGIYNYKDANIPSHTGVIEIVKD